MFNNVNNTFSNRKRTNSLLVLALIFVLSIFAVGCDSTAEEAAAAGESSVQTAVQETAVQETAVETTAVETTAVEVNSQAADMAAVEVTDADIIETTSTVSNQNNNGNSNAANGNNGANNDPEHIPAADLAAQMDTDISDEEAAALAFMREEEKLARDVYLTLYDVWGTAVFNNIASSEQVHMDAVLMLMNQYGLPDPATGNAVGIFTNPDLQALYNDLTARGNQSQADAYAVGATIEEIDIMDLQTHLNETVNPAIIQVYTSLMGGSESHLRAYVPQWQIATGTQYAPQYMDQARFDTIMSDTAGNGQHGGNGQGNNGNGDNGQHGGNGQGSNGNGDNGQHGGNGQVGNGNGGNGQGGNGQHGGNEQGGNGNGGNEQGGNGQGGNGHGNSHGNGQGGNGKGSGNGQTQR